MKYLVFILCLLPAIAGAQSKSDYERAIGSFMQYYNNNRADSICMMFSNYDGRKESCPWNKKNHAAIKKEYGKMLSYRYVGKCVEDPEKVILFLVEFSKKTFGMSLTLTGGKKLGTFRFNTTSEEIEAMLKKAKSNTPTL